MKKTTPSKTDEFTRFEELTRKLVSVPKKDIQEQEKNKASKRESRSKRT